MTSLLERLGQAAYEAHRDALTTPLPPWEDLTKEEQQAWKAAASAVAGQTGTTIPEGPDTPPLVVQIGDQRQSFTTDFTAGRDGILAIDDTASITPGAVVVVIDNTTTAAISDGATVAADGNIADQERHSSGDILWIAAAGAVAGTASVGGSVSYVGVNDTTWAFIGQSATSDSDGAK